MEFKNYHMGYFEDSSNNSKDMLDELFIISRNNVIVKEVLDYYRHDMKYSYPQLVENLNEILFTLTKTLLGQNNDLQQSLKEMIEQSDKPIFFK